MNRNTKYFLIESKIVNTCKLYEIYITLGYGSVFIIENKILTSLNSFLLFYRSCWLVVVPIACRKCMECEIHRAIISLRKWREKNINDF